MHGLTITESATGPRPVQDASLSTIGVVVTAAAAAGAPTAALDDMFPVNTPVLVTDIDAALSLVLTGGTLNDTLQAIADQTSPILVVVRVNEGADQAATDTAVIGGVVGNDYTGLQALVNAEAVVGVRPRIIGAPGLDTATVTAALVIAAKKLRGMAYARAIGADQAAAILYRATYSARELMLIWPNFTGGFAGDAVARALGLRARIDEQIGWHKTISNVQVDGVTGIDKDVSFDLLDPSTAAGLLNDADITTLVRTTGFRFWGNRTCSDLPEFAFESAVRTSQALQDICATAILPFVDQPLTVGMVKDLLETMNAEVRQLISEGRIIGANFEYRPEDNSSTALSEGKPKFRFTFTPAAPMENPQVGLIITDFYYAGFADQLN
jgi:phage tail sheath protein FI